MNPSTPATDTPDRHRAARGALWISAAVIAALITLRAGWPGAPVAHAEMAAKAGAYAGMTTTSSNQEYLYLVDDRSETMLIYGVTQDEVELLYVQDLPQMFEAARGAAASTP